MARRPRTFVEGLYHVGSHGSDVRDLYCDDDDRMSFLDRLALVLGRFQLRLVDYALLGNHYHLVLGTPGGRISSAMQQLHTWYSRAHNRRHERSAHLFRAHFFARELTSDVDLLGACRYVAMNPVEAGLCLDAFAWPWSSAAVHAGLTETAMALDTGPLRAALGDRDDWRRRYRDLIETAG
jgi:REP element-mobilizing transposase RayT